MATKRRRKDRRSAEEVLIGDHLGLVRAAVARLSARLPRHAAGDELLSAGMIGLVQAARSFDHTRGIPFPRFAGARIKGALLDELREHDWASRPVRAQARHMDRVTERLTTSLGRAPENREVAEAMGTDVAEVERLVLDLHRATVVNYDGLVASAENLSPLVDEVDPEVELMDRERKAYLVDAVRALPPRLQTVIIGYFYEERSMHDIGMELGVSGSRISQLCAEALALLRNSLDSQLEPSCV